MDYRHLPVPKSVSQVPFTALVPAFTISELTMAFQMGFMLYIPFLLTDLVVSLTFTSLGMLMLPPVTISLPFKILPFVLVDGLYFVVKSPLAGYT